MKWEREPWRKLYVRTTAEWRALPLSARGLGDELIKYADDDGVVVIVNDGEHPGDAISRTVGAHPHEFDRVREDCDALMKGGRDAYLVLRGNRLVMRNFYEAQNRVTPSAVRMQRKRQKEKEEKRHSDAGSDAHSDEPCDAGSDAHVTGKRNEEKRNEESTPIAPKGVPLVLVPEEPTVDPAAETFDHWRDTFDHPRAVCDDKRRRLISKAIADHGVDKVRAAITGCRATPHNMGHNQNRERYDSIGLILKNADQIERFAARAHLPPVDPPEERDESQRPRNPIYQDLEDAS